VAGVCINLTLPLDQPGPRLFGRPDLAHEVYARSASMIEDRLDDLDPQASSQWDSLRHFSAGRSGFYGGVKDWQSAASEALGIHRWLEVGIVVRGVLIDMPRYWEQEGQQVDPFDERAVTVDEIGAAADRCGIAFTSADLLLVRTGWLRRFRDSEVSPGQAEKPVGAGLHAGTGMARFLWDHHLVAVAADNPAVEVLPGDPQVGSLHRRCLAGLGMPFGELWDLETLADHCAGVGRWTCCVVSVPLNVTGGVGSPANAMAIV
jgi:kynurenine formamidase